jgi:hypothetical protein
MYYLKCVTAQDSIMSAENVYNNQHVSDKEELTLWTEHQTYKLKSSAYLLTTVEHFWDPSIK